MIYLFKNDDFPWRTLDLSEGIIQYSSIPHSYPTDSIEDPKKAIKSPSTAALFPQHPLKSSKITIDSSIFLLNSPFKMVGSLGSFVAKGDGELGDSKLGVGGGISARLAGPFPWPSHGGLWLDFFLGFF